MPYTEYYDRSPQAGYSRQQRGQSMYSSRSSRVRFAIGEEPGTSQDRYAASHWQSGNDDDLPGLIPANEVDHSSPRYHEGTGQGMPSAGINAGDPNASRKPEDIEKDPERGPDNNGVKPVADSDMEDGYLTHFVEHDEDNNWDNLDEQQPSPNEEPEEEGDQYYEQVIDEDDPLITHKRKQQLDDFDNLDYPQHRSYRERRKSARAVKIQYNVSSIVNREKFLIKLGRALMTFGAPSHRIEAQLLSAARILELKAEFIHVPGLIMCSFINEDEKSSETHFIRCKGRMALGRLHEVHTIYRGVVHDELSAKRAGQKLDALLEARPIYGSVTQLILSFWIATLICPLAFGGSLVDMWLAGFFAVFLAIMRNGVIAKAKSWYAHVFEVCVVMLISFAARALGSIPGGIFCYNAIASASIVSILPGFLILSGSLELASKNIACGSIKMMYALIYTFFLGFGLQIGNDLYLVIDHRARDRLDDLATRVYTSMSVVGEFVPDNGTFSFINHGLPLNGTFTFMDLVDPTRDDRIIVGCLREPELPWYLQPFPWWSQFIIVPIFSLLSSLMNLQPIWSWDMLVMIVISCISYTTNKIANHFIPNRSDFVSFIGAFSVGILGNLYSRRMNGTAFTVMVTGVLFLVPSGLSAVGGITAQGSGIDIGGAMIAVVIGVTCGLFVSQAVVYAFGTRKNAAIFSF